MALERFVVALLRRQQQFGQRLPLDHAESKDGEHEGQHHGRYIKKAAQPLPAFPLRIIKNLFHALLVFLATYCMCSGAS